MLRIGGLVLLRGRLEAVVIVLGIVHQLLRNTAEVEQLQQKHQGQIQKLIGGKGACTAQEQHPCHGKGVVPDLMV